jgi:hypothetical protein
LNANIHSEVLEYYLRCSVEIPTEYYRSIIPNLRYSISSIEQCPYLKKGSIRTLVDSGRWLRAKETLDVAFRQQYSRGRGRHNG